MSQPVISLASLGPQDQARFKQLTRAPEVAWPTVWLAVVISAIFIASDILAITGRQPLWLAMLINSACGYFAFSVVHDAIHRAISTNVSLNDWIGRLILPLAVPYATLAVFRWNHIQHHRFANGPKDPDLVFQGPWWQLPVRWMLIDVFYVNHMVRNLDKVSRPYFYDALRVSAVAFPLMGLLIWYGYGMDLLMLWFIPSRLLMLGLGFSFYWLPHVPHDVTQAENFTRATTIRLGYERLMNVLLQHQNFHLIHHLYPNTPYYNNGRVWHLIEPELRKHDLAIQHDFAIRPTIYPAPGTSAAAAAAPVARGAAGRVSHA
jgi:beta-carotene hydroxylase